MPLGPRQPLMPLRDTCRLSTHGAGRTGRSGPKRGEPKRDRNDRDPKNVRRRLLEGGAGSAARKEEVDR